MSGDRAKSSLNNKVMRLLGVVIAILLLGNGLIFAFVIWPTFSELERREGEQNAQRVAEALEGTGRPRPIRPRFQRVGSDV